jgi:hypothetical protein
MRPEADPVIPPRPAKEPGCLRARLSRQHAAHWIDRIRSASGLLRGNAVASVRAALTAAQPKANLVQRL